MNYNSLKTTLILCSLGLIGGTCLPWAEVRSSVDFLGNHSSFYDGKLGFEIPSGKYVAILGGISFLMCLTSFRWIIIPGTIAFLISLITVLGYGSVSVSFNSSIGNSYAGAGIGVYISFLSCIGLVFYGIKALRMENIILSPPIEAEPTTIKTEPKSTTESATVPENEKRFWNATNIVLIASGTLSLLILSIGTCNHFQNIELQEIEEEKSRIGNLRNLIQDAISKENYQEAVILTNSFHWDYKPSEYPEFVSSHQEEQGQLEYLVKVSKAEKDSIRIRNEMLKKVEEQQQEVEANRDMQLAHSIVNFPFLAMIGAVKCYVYAEPNVNAERKFQLIQETDIRVMSSQNEFYYCSFELSAGIKEYGWIYYNDIVK